MLSSPSTPYLSIPSSFSNSHYDKSSISSTSSKLPTKSITTTKLTGRPRGGKNKLPKFGNINWNTFGIPWSINHPQFRAINTCPLDTALMTWYFINRHGDAALPDELLNSSIGTTLQKVVEYIHREEYEEARWIWCRDVLELHPTATDDKAYDMFGSIEEVFRDKLPGLFLLRKMETSTCTSPHCPRPHRTMQRSFPSFDTGMGLIDQTSVEASLMRLDPVYNDKCSYEHQPDIIGKIDEEYWRYNSSFDEDGEP
ncbi:hypothetical protein FBU30_003042, partial [Linnemannia zychae]